ncbi:N-terminal nucleophile aminohydrolase [Thermothelomyces heterothallicus CBS 203.75]
MSFLKAGATATQAVEAAIRCLEDKEITNAGFGSNLNIDGVVECDATIVDHLGRSGACGAVAGVKNPISLAKKILDTSSQPLSLRRVPPNILVGPGAKEFAEEHALKIVRNEFLVSRNAKDRYLRWNEDLKRAEARKRPRTAYSGVNWSGQRTPSPGAYDKAANPTNTVQLRDHASAILTGTWNEGQPDSPDSGRSPIGESASRTAADSSASPASQPPGNRSASLESTERVGLGAESPYLASMPLSSRPVNDGPASCDDTEVHTGDGKIEYHDTDGLGTSCDKVKRHHATTQSPVDVEQVADMVTDTVGAIAVDLRGNIAAGSSSGGIGMKHKGRTGPAALVGVGTAVVPEDPDDDFATSVAAVTSGTGEHMATCMASSKCAERLFQGTRRGPGGRDIPEEDEHTIMESFILDDFMNHPGVRDQPSVGAIGVMAVKKDLTGIYFYFAHNTDSFALASMSSTEREPLCVMSRLGKTGRVAQGGRRIRLG